MSTSQCTSVGAANKSTIPQLSLHCCTCRLGFLNLWQHRLASTYPTVMMDIEWQHFPAVLYVVAAVWYFNLPSCFTMSHYTTGHHLHVPESLVPGNNNSLFYISQRDCYICDQSRVLPTVHLLGGVGQFENFAPSIRASQDLIE
jgi:hypothetical protein